MSAGALRPALRVREPTAAPRIMTPIIAVFMSMISLLALVADRANLQEQGEAIPLPSVDDGVSRNFLDVAKRTLPLKMTPARTINMRRVPRAADAAAAAAPDVLEHVLELQHDVLLQSLLIHALRRRDIREQLFASTSTSTERPPADAHPRPTTASPRSKGPSKDPHKGAHKGPPKGPSKGPAKGPSKGPARGPNSLGELRENLMVHGRDRDQLRRRWKIEAAGNRVANVRG